jgi:S1-C subfamily serine protease
MLRLSTALILILSAGQAGLAGQQPQEPAGHALPRGAVTVFHSVDLLKLAHRLNQGHSSIGIMMPPGQNPINITTGLVLDQAGHIVTRLVNLDPEDMDQDLAVRTSDGLQFRAKLVGVDCPTGFAVLEVAAGSGLVPAPLTDGSVEEGIQVKLFSSDLGNKAEIHDGVIKFSPDVNALYGKIVQGTLFSRARGALTLESIGLSPKNDSGIVETLDNRVVGMAQWAGLSPGMAYVFTYDFLRGQVLTRVLDRNGTVPAGWLGVVADTPAPGSPRGVVVKEIQPKSTAELCGLQARDVIVGLDEYEITGQAEMAAVLSGLPAGRKIRLRALRDEKPMEIEAVLGAQQVRPILPWVPSTPPPNPSLQAMVEEKLQEGFIARDLTSQLADYFGVKGGMLVTEVSKGSPADRAGLAAGDVVVGADGKELRSVLDLKSLMSNKSGAIKLMVYRNRSTVSVEIPKSNSPALK